MYKMGDFCSLCYCFIVKIIFYPCRYYKVNEVQKFTFSKKKDESQNDITVGITIGWEIFEDIHINGRFFNVHAIV